MGIPAPFPLVAHNPTAQPPRPPPRAPRQFSRNTAALAFTTCLLSDEPLSPAPPSASPPDQEAPPSQDPAAISQHTAGAPGASGLAPQHSGGTAQEGEHADMYCHERLDHAGHDYYNMSHAQRQADLGTAMEAEMVEAPAEHSDHGCFTCPHSAAQHSAYPHSAAEHPAHPHSAVEHPANPHSAAEHPAHSQSAAEHSAHPHSAADQSAQSQASDLHKQSCKDFQTLQASPACQQAEDTRAEPSMHHDGFHEPLGAPPADPHHAEHHHVPQLGPEQQQPPQLQPQQQQQCRSYERVHHADPSAANLLLPQQQQVPAGRVQHDQAEDHMHAPLRSPASGSHPLASQQSDKPINSDAGQAGQQQPGPPPSTAAASASVAPATARASVAPALQSPQRAQASPLLDPALLAQLSRHAHPQGPDTASHHPSTDNEPRSHAATPVASAKPAVSQRPAGPTAAAQSTLSNGCPESPHCPQSPRQQMQSEVSPLSAHDGSKQDRVRTSPNTSTHASPQGTHKTDTRRLNPVQQLAEEDFEQDQMSQPSSSESDEDFQPSEYEQDEMSQPSSSSGDEEMDEDEDEDDDAFEVDELSQPESSSEDGEQSPLRAESDVRVCSTAQAQPPIMIIKSRQEDVVHKYVRKSSKAQLPTTAASGRDGVKRSRTGSLAADHKARLGFPKPAQPAKAVPVPNAYLTGSSLPFNGQNLLIDQSQQG